MVTLFTTPKPFRGHIGIIQRNALRSWTLLPSCDVVLYGDEEGAADAASELGCRHVPAIARNEFGTPLIKALFDDARRRATRSLLAYVNADIILMKDFADLVRALATMTDRFVTTGQRFNLDLSTPLAFDAPWEDHVRSRAVAHGTMCGLGMDYFVFPRDLWTDIPARLAVGRAAWDNWPVYVARLHKAIVVDATQMVMAMDVTHILTSRGLNIRCRACYPVCVCKPSSF